MSAKMSEGLATSTKHSCSEEMVREDFSSRQVNSFVKGTLPWKNEYKIHFGFKNKFYKKKQN